MIDDALCAMRKERERREARDQGLADADEAVDELLASDENASMVHAGSAYPQAVREAGGIRTRTIVHQPRPKWYALPRLLNPFRQYFPDWVVYVQVSCTCGCTSSVGASERCPVPPTPELVADYTRSAVVRGMRAYVELRAQQDSEILAEQCADVGLGPYGRPISFGEFMERFSGPAKRTDSGKVSPISGDVDTSELPDDDDSTNETKH